MADLNPSDASGSRWTLWIILGFVAAVLLSPVVFLATCVYLGETPTSRYASLKEARAAGALGEGKWIPPFLPESSRHIVETHDIDTNELRITFEYTPGDLGGLSGACRRAGTSLTFDCDGWGEAHLDESGNGVIQSKGN